MLQARAGQEHEAEETIQRAVEIGKGFGHFHHTAYNIAMAYSFNGLLRFVEQRGYNSLPTTVSLLPAV